MMTVCACITMEWLSNDDVGLHWSNGTCEKSVPGVETVGYLAWVPVWLKEWVVGFSSEVESSGASVSVLDVSKGALARL
jgi:hypothetical protein